MTGILVDVFFGEPFGGLLPGARGAVLAVLMRTGTALTGRQIHAMVSDQFSLWSVQEALKALTELGIAETRTVGRAGVHTINESHAAVAALRTVIDPIAVLTEAVTCVVGSDVETVLVFGSVARGEATASSDVDLAVIARTNWDGRVELQDAIRSRLGNECDVLVFTSAEFARLAREGEPVVQDIVRDGVAIMGTKPRVKVGAR